MAKVPGCVKTFAGLWRIVGTSSISSAEAHLTFKGLADGEIAFKAAVIGGVPSGRPSEPCRPMKKAPVAMKRCR